MFLSCDKGVCSSNVFTIYIPFALGLLCMIWCVIHCPSKSSYFRYFLLSNWSAPESKCSGQRSSKSRLNCITRLNFYIKVLWVWRANGSQDLGFYVEWFIPGVATEDLGWGYERFRTPWIVTNYYIRGDISPRFLPRGFGQAARRFLSSHFFEREKEEKKLGLNLGR